MSKRATLPDMGATIRRASAATPVEPEQPAAMRGLNTRIDNDLFVRFATLTRRLDRKMQDTVAEAVREWVERNE